MSSALQQPARQLGGGTSTQAPANPMLGKPGLDINALLQMILQSQQTMQGNMLDAATKPQSKIAQSPRNQQRTGGLAGWYEMNPQALQGESYNQSRAAQVQGNQITRQKQGMQGRLDLAGMINQLSQMQNQFLDTNQGDISRLPVNPFYGF